MKAAKKIMSVSLFLGGLALFTFSTIPAAQAHPPAGVELTYNMQKQVLEVKITHTSSDLSRHYVKKVVIKKNGEVVGGGEYQSQPDKESFIYAYTIDAAIGDLLEVTAICSIFGSKLAELKVQ